MKNNNYYFEDKSQFQIEIDEMNKKEQEHLEKEFVEYKNLGLILFDIIPIKERKFLIESLKKLFEYDKFTQSQRAIYRLEFEKVLPEVEIDSTLHSCCNINIGRIQNLNLGNDDFISTPERKLPLMFHNLRIDIAQFGDVYLFIIVGELKKEFKTKGIKESFIHLNDMEISNNREIISAQKSIIKCDPNMELYLKELTIFLKEFGFGIYLNQDSNQICPNIKVTYLEEIPFDNFEEWELKNRSLLEFMGFSFIFSKIKNNLWGIQNKRIANKLSISAGLVILTSKDEEILDKYEFLESGILIELVNFRY